MSENSNVTDTTIAERTILVHKSNEEGALIINALSGRVEQPHDERPAWSEGLALAVVGERMEFYKTRLGPYFTDDMRVPEAIDFRDLGWVGVDEDQNEAEFEADQEYRMENVAEILGIVRTDNLDELINFGPGNIVAEVEIGMDVHRSAEEHELFVKEQERLSAHG